MTKPTFVQLREAFSKCTVSLLEAAKILEGQGLKNTAEMMKTVVSESSMMISEAYDEDSHAKTIEVTDTHVRQPK